MKLLIYSHFFPPSVGGVETIVLSLARGLAERSGPEGSAEFEVTLVTQTPAANWEDSLSPFRVVRRPGHIQLWRLIRSADVVHIAGPALAPTFFSLLARRPVVIEHHGFQTICPNGQLLMEPQGRPCPGHFMAGRHNECLRCNSPQGWLASWKLWLLTSVRRFLCAQVAANIVPTQWLGGLLQLPRTTTIPHGLEPRQIIAPTASRSGTPVIAFMGRLVTTKGMYVLLNAAKILLEQNRTFELLIIGDGPERPALEQFVRESQLTKNVRFAGRLDGDQLETSLARAAAVVVPSLGGEVFGMVVAENMVRGLPIVASDLGAFTEVLGDAGLSFRTGDATDLAKKIGRLLNDAGLANQLAQRARERATQSFSLGDTINAHARQYKTTESKERDLF